MTSLEVVGFYRDLDLPIRDTGDKGLFEYCHIAEEGPIGSL